MSTPFVHKSWRRSAALICAVVLALLGCKEEKFDPVKGFDSALKLRVARTEASTPIWQNPVTKQWRMTRTRVAGLQYDVKNNDSLVSPYKGIVSFVYLTEESDDEPTAADAKAAVVFPNPSIYGSFTVSLTYLGSEKGWNILDGRYVFNHEPSYEYPLNPNRITTINTPPFVQLYDWLTLTPGP